MNASFLYFKGKPWVKRFAPSFDVPMSSWMGWDRDLRIRAIQERGIHPKVPKVELLEKFTSTIDGKTLVADPPNTLNYL